MSRSSFSHPRGGGEGIRRGGPVSFVDDFESDDSDDEEEELQDIFDRIKNATFNQYSTCSEELLYSVKKVMKTQFSPYASSHPDDNYDDIIDLVDHILTKVEDFKLSEKEAVEIIAPFIRGDGYKLLVFFRRRKGIKKALIYILYHFGARQVARDRKTASEEFIANYVITNVHEIRRDIAFLAYHYHIADPSSSNQEMLVKFHVYRLLDDDTHRRVWKEERRYLHVHGKEMPLLKFAKAIVKCEAESESNLKANHAWNIVSNKECDVDQEFIGISERDASLSSCSTHSRYVEEGIDVSSSEDKEEASSETYEEENEEPEEQEPEKDESQQSDEIPDNNDRYQKREERNIQPPAISVAQQQAQEKKAIMSERDATKKPPSDFLSESSFPLKKENPMKNEEPDEKRPSMKVLQCTERLNYFRILKTICQAENIYAHKKTHVNLPSFFSLTNNLPHFQSSSAEGRNLASFALSVAKCVTVHVAFRLFPP